MNALVEVKTTLDLAQSGVIEKYLPEKAREIVNIPTLMMIARENPTLQPVDFIYFAQQCALTGANPALKQVHLITFNKKIKLKKEKVGPNGNMIPYEQETYIQKGEVIFSYNYILLRASQHKDYGSYEIKFENKPKFDPISAKTKEVLACSATVLKKDGTSVVFTAWWDEFVKQDCNGNVDGQWKKQPYVMLEKVALCNALRRAFPDWLNSVYSDEEMNIIDESNENPPKPFEAKKDTPVNLANKVTSAVSETIPQKPEQAPTPKDSDNIVDADFHEVPADISFDIPDEQPKQEEPAQPIQEPEKKEEPAKTPDVVLATKGTKISLNKKLTKAETDGILDKQKAIEKLNAVTLTEDLAKKLCEGLDKGDASWFK